MLRYASLLTDPDTAPTRGVDLALNELADVAEEEWIELVMAPSPRTLVFARRQHASAAQRSCTPLTLLLATLADYRHTGPCEWQAELGQVAPLLYHTPRALIVLRL